MTAPSQPAHRRWFRPTPGRVIAALLAVEAGLWLSDRLGWWPKGYAVLTAMAAVGAAVLLLAAWYAAALVFRWRFPFTIRSPLALTVAVALTCSWLAVELKKARDQDEAVRAMRKLGAWLYYDWEFDTNFNSLPDPKPPGPPWLRSMTGDNFLGRVTVVNFGGGPWKVTDADLEHLKMLPHLRGLSLSSCWISDAALKHVKDLQQLRWLSLQYTDVTDTGLRHLEGLRHLVRLDLAVTDVTDAGLEHLRALTKLRELSLAGDAITDAGLEHLTGLTQLEELDLTAAKQLNFLYAGPNVTDEAAEKLQRALPNCNIMR